VAAAPSISVRSASRLLSKRSRARSRSGFDGARVCFLRETALLGGRGVGGRGRGVPKVFVVLLGREAAEGIDTVLLRAHRFGNCFERADAGETPRCADAGGATGGRRALIGTGAGETARSTGVSLMSLRPCRTGAMGLCSRDRQAVHPLEVSKQEVPPVFGRISPSCEASRCRVAALNEISSSTDGAVSGFAPTAASPGGACAR